MGEQSHTQTEALPKPESLIETPNSNSQPSACKSDPNLQIPNPHPATSLPDPIATEISHNNPHNPSKIPIRPQKIRKLSAQTTAVEKLAADDSSASSSAINAVSAAAATSVAITSAKNRRRSASHASRVLPQVIKPLSADGEIELALRHLRAVDPLLGPLIDSNQTPHFETHHHPFLALTKSILYQQLAYKAGNSIYTRFVSLCGGEDAICPDSVLALSSQQLKQIGVSGRKASYLYDLANKYKSGILSDDSVMKMDDRSLFTMLSMVKGIGSWSVHMFMIFSLHRPDVLPVSDLGVRKGVMQLYGLEELPRPSQMEQLCEKWKPYRSVGAWYMWRVADVKSPASGSIVPIDGGVVQPLQQIDPHQDGHQHQHQHQLQFVEPVNGIGNMGNDLVWPQFSGAGNAGKPFLLPKVALFDKID